MFTKIPIILDAEQLLDRAIRKTKKIQLYDRDVRFKIKKTTIARIDSFATVIISTLEKYVKEFPSIEQLPSFYQEIIDIKIDTNKLKKSLGAVDWARKTCAMIYSKQRRALKKTGNVDFLKQKQKEIYGRISSVVKQIDEHLMFLATAQNIMKKFPYIQDVPTVVIAGYPNVGKSSLVNRITGQNINIVTDIPGTTRDSIDTSITHFGKKCTFIDTAGLRRKKRIKYGVEYLAKKVKHLTNSDCLTLTN